MEMNENFKKLNKMKKETLQKIIEEYNRNRKEKKIPKTGSKAQL